MKYPKEYETNQAQHREARLYSSSEVASAKHVERIAAAARGIRKKHLGGGSLDEGDRALRAESRTKLLLRERQLPDHGKPWFYKGVSKGYDANNNHAKNRMRSHICRRQIFVAVRPTYHDLSR